MVLIELIILIIGIFIGIVLHHMFHIGHHLMTALNLTQHYLDDGVEGWKGLLHHVMPVDDIKIQTNQLMHSGH